MYAGTYDRDLAMAVGDAFDPEDVSPWELAEMCSVCGLPQRQTARTLKALCENLTRCLAEFDFSVELTADEHDFANGLFGKVRANAGRFLEMARMLPGIVL